MNDSGDPHRVLARNAACHQCRRRKLKCDAMRPTCGNCRKPRQRGPEKYEPPEACTWDEMRDPSSRTMRKREAKARSVNQGRPLTTTPAVWAGSHHNGHTGQPTGPTAHQQQQHAAHVPPPGQYIPPRPAPLKVEPYSNLNGYGHAPLSGLHPPQGPIGVTGAPSVSPNGTPGTSAFPAGVSWDDQQQPQQSLPAGPQSATMPTHTGLGSAFTQAGPTSAPPIAGTGFSGMNDPPLSLNPQGSQMMYSEWPRDLPSPAVVHHIFGIFFDRVRVVPMMLHRATLMANLSLPPSHRDFPALALIHAICAAAASNLPPESLASRDYFPTGSPANAVVHPEHDFSPRMLTSLASAISYTSSSVGDGTPLHRFQMWHRRKTFDNLGDQATTGSSLVQFLQSIVIINSVDASNGWWSDVWIQSSNAVRIAQPLFLNLSGDHNHDPLGHNISSLLPPAATLQEQAERDRTWWAIYISERTSCFGVLWPSAIADDEVLVELPVTQAMYDSGQGALRGVQTLQSPDFYSHHPPQHVDALSLLVKATRVYVETLTFMRKYSRGLHTYQRYFTDSRFQQVLSNINTLRQNLPPEFRRPYTQTEHGEVVDPDKFFILNLIHAAFLSIGGPLITHQSWSNPAGRMILNEIRGVLSLIYELSKTSFDITYLSNTNAFVWYLAARSIVRFIAAARASNTPQAQMEIAVFENELAMLLAVMARLGDRYPVALRYMKLVEVYRNQHAEPQGEIIPLKQDKALVFDPEWGSTAPRKTSSTGSLSMSPATFGDGTTPSTVSAGASVPPNGSGVSPQVGLSPAVPSMGGVPQVPNQQVPVPQQQQQQPQQQQQHQSAGMAYPQSDDKGLSQWFKMEPFDIGSYSFDVEAMTQLVNQDPGLEAVPIDRSMLGFPQL